MGTLRDEAYEKLDYLSQLTEVVIGPQNEVLARAPDRLELTFEQIDASKSRTWGAKIGYELSVFQILTGLMSTDDITYVSDIKQYFKFEVSDDFELDIANKKMTGTITLVKTVQQVDEKKILEIAVDKSCRQLSHYDWPHKRLREKIITVLNLFEPNYGTEWAKNLTGRASWAGQNELRSMFSKAVLENKWRIRDSEVILKVGEWIQSYLSDPADGLGLVNLMKLKMMLDKDLPVYSVDEVTNGDAAGTTR
jgi:hypothetical protein